MSQINALPINGFTIADLALLAPGPGQFLEVGGATEGRIDIDALAAYARVGTATASQGTLAEAALQPSDAGATGLALLATATAADARSAIGAMANTAPEIITNANGTAYRWPNGLQICTWQGTTALIAAFNWGPVTASNSVSLVFPAAFNTRPMVSAAGGWRSGGPSIYQAWEVYQNISPTDCSVFTVGAFLNASCFPAYLAIGTYTP